MTAIEDRGGSGRKKRQAFRNLGGDGLYKVPATAGKSDETARQEIEESSLEAAGLMGRIEVKSLL